VLKALDVLHCFEMGSADLSLAQISRQLQMPKSTLLNLIKTLESEGYLYKVENTQNYRLGLKILELAFQLRSSMPVIQYALPFIEDIQVATEENVYLTTHRNGRVLYLESAIPNKSRIKYSISGKVLPMHCTSCGRAMLSCMKDEEVKAIIEYWGLAPSTPNSISDSDSLFLELEKIRKRGYAQEKEEETLGISCVSIAIRNSQSHPVGAISVSGAVLSMTEEKVQLSIQLLSRACAMLSEWANLFPYKDMNPKT